MAFNRLTLILVLSTAAIVLCSAGKRETNKVGKQEFIHESRRSIIVKVKRDFVSKEDNTGEVQNEKQRDPVTTSEDNTGGVQNEKEKDPVTTSEEKEVSKRDTRVDSSCYPVSVEKEETFCFRFYECFTVTYIATELECLD